ncbi:OmpA family protein [Novosphingobium sp.]|uniref:OmpA family protein n=1 Tax=Novosphingobium sp. TaxID=1874826 RepID=UPI0035AF5506
MERTTIAVVLGGAMAAGLLAVAGVQTVRSGGLHRAAPVQAGVAHCQSTIDGILKTRTIRFQEASAALDPASEVLLDEVAAALRPCAGGRVAITGHTDARGDEAANIALSLDRARTVREALVQRGIARTDLRARGKGSSQPVDGLDPTDPANRRIEFAVLTPARIHPTLIDTPSVP